MVKPGYKTSEFWLSLLAMLVGFFVASGVLPETHIAMKIAGIVVAALSGLGYTVGRSGVKKLANGSAPAVPPAEPSVDEPSEPDDSE